jgi:hypothetical protein
VSPIASLLADAGLLPRSPNWLVTMVSTLGEPGQQMQQGSVDVWIVPLGDSAGSWQPFEVHCAR